MHAATASLTTIELSAGLTMSLTARAVDTEDYVPVSGTGLRASVRTRSGSGAREDPWQVELTVSNPLPEPWLGVVHTEVSANQEDARFFLPAVVYGHNRGESPLNIRREWPRLRHAPTDLPASSWWMFRADRLSHPVALAHGSGRLIGISAAPVLVREGATTRGARVGDAAADLAQFAGFTCSLEQGRVGYTLGYENAPRLFVNAATVHDRADLREGALELPGGGQVTTTLLVFDMPSEHASDIGAVVESVYRRVHEPPRQVSTPRRTVEQLAAAVHRDAWLPHRRAYAGFVFQDPDGGHSKRELLSISWTNGLVVSTPMLLAGLRLGDEGMRERARCAIDEIVTSSLNEASGLPYDAVSEGRWSTRGWWADGVSDRGHSGYLVGQAVYLVLKAYDYERRLGGVDHDSWLAFATRTMEVAERTRNADGEFPYLLSERTGAGIVYDSLGSAWLLAAAAYLRELTGRRDGLDELLQSEAHYHRSQVATMECYGGPLDTDKAIDSEGVVGYLKAVRHLHSITGSEELLDHLREGLSYEYTFRFGYNVWVQVPPLSRLGWSSCGGTVTSTANPHIHPMGSTLVDEMCHYLEHRDDAHVASRLQDAVAWGAQTYNTRDGEFDHGLEGWMSERFAHSQGLLTQHYPDGAVASTWFCLMPWASGCVIDGMVGAYWDRSVAPVA